MMIYHILAIRRLAILRWEAQVRRRGRGGRSYYSHYYDYYYYHYYYYYFDCPAIIMFIISIIVTTSSIAISIMNSIRASPETRPRRSEPRCRGRRRRAACT